MDTLTHALSGALLARASVPREPSPGALSTRARVTAGFFAAAFPDLDFLVAFVGPVEYLTLHRGVTHSVLLLPVWAWLLAWIFSRIARDPRGWRPWFGISALALGAHIAGDLITSFGTMVFAPVSDWRAAIGTTFIIDLWFTGIIAAGLVVSLAWRRSRVPALAAGVVLAGYVGMQWGLREQALDFGEHYAATQDLHGAAVTVHPRPVSPFNWTVFVSDDSEHRIAHVNLVREAPRAIEPEDGFIARLDAAYVPQRMADWEVRPRFGDTPEARAVAVEAWNSDALAFFRWFADAPAFDGITEGSTCVWFADLRFLTPGRDTLPFRYGACREAPGGVWRAYQRSGESGRVPLG